MADEADSKSVVGNNVRVQVPPPALKILIGISYDGYTDFFISYVSSEAIFDNTMAISMIKLSLLFCRIKKKVR